MQQFPFLCIVLLKNLNKVAGKKIESQLCLWLFTIQFFPLPFFFENIPKYILCSYSNGSNVIRSFLNARNTQYIYTLTIRRVIRTNHHEMKFLVFVIICLKHTKNGENVTTSQLTVYLLKFNHLKEEIYVRHKTVY